MEIDSRKFRHDINSLFFKLETSISLLKTELTEEEKKSVLNIIENVQEKLKFLTKVFLIEKELKNYKPDLQNLDLSPFLDVNIFIQGDKALIKNMFEILKFLNKNNEFDVKHGNDKIILNGDFKGEDEIEKYIFLILKEISKKTGLELKINSKKVEINWKKNTKS